MDRGRAGRNRTQRCGSYCNVTEPEYDVVDDPEEGAGVRILPAKPINEDREYADRDLPRSSSAHCLPPVCAGHDDVTQNRRETLQTAAPPINRAVKPGRRKYKYDKKPPATPEEQHQPRCPPPPSTHISELISRLSAADPHDGCRRDREQRNSKKTGLKSHSRGSHSTERGLTHSLEQESHDVETRSTGSLERVPSKRGYHEWPQTKEDWDQHDFVPMEKPQQTDCKDDWYVGACSRADAEHALHLVNRDGAFLIRDCSVNTDSEPLVLVVYHEKKVYNVKIRFIESTNMYALGNGQRSNEMFHSVADIIKFHSIFPIVLVSGRNLPASKHPESCVLTCPLTRTDMERLLL